MENGPPLGDIEYDFDRFGIFESIMHNENSECTLLFEGICMGLVIVFLFYLTTREIQTRLDFRQGSGIRDSRLLLLGYPSLESRVSGVSFQIPESRLETQLWGLARPKHLQ